MSRVLSVFFAMIAFSCTKNEPLGNSASSQTNPPASTQTISAKDPTATSEVNLAIWGNYLSQDMQDKFTKETGIKINISNYSSNEELLAKVQTGASGLDVAVPSDYMVGVMIKLGLLEGLDKSQISNGKLIAAEYLKQSYDPENKYSLPYAWGTAGIAVNRDLYKGPIKSWKDLLENPALAGKFSLLDDVREVTAAALLLKGYKINTLNPKEIAEARKVLLKAKKSVKLFSSNAADILKNKEVVAAHAYSMDSLQAAKSGTHIEYIIPEEGGTRAIDNLVILKGAKHAQAALKLLNYLLSPEVNISFVKNVLGGPVLKGTRAALPQELQDNKALFPDAKTFGKLDSLHDLGADNKLYEDLWTEVKAQ